MEPKSVSDKDFNEVLKKYEQNIVLPKFKPLHQFFLCSVGLVGAGKTTVLKPLSEKLSLVRISGDEIRKILYDRGFNFERVWEIGDTLVKKFAYEGYGIANDTDGATPRTGRALTD